MRTRYILSPLLLSLNFTQAFYINYQTNNAIMKNQPTMSLNFNGIKKKLITN